MSTIAGNDRGESTGESGRMRQQAARHAGWPGGWARIAGGLYLFNIVGGFFAIGVVPSLLVVQGNAGVTANNILQNELLYRSSLAVHIMILLTNIPLAAIFYDLFKTVSRRPALFVVFFGLVGTAVEAASILNQFVPLILLQGGGYTSAFSAEQLQALAYAPLGLWTIGFNISLVFFGFYGLSIGYLTLRSGFLPRTLGVLLAIGGLSYVANSLANFLAPVLAAGLFPAIGVPSLLGEASFCLWLLVKGVNIQQWKEQASAAGASMCR